MLNYTSANNYSSSPFQTWYSSRSSRWSGFMSTSRERRHQPTSRHLRGRFNRFLHSQSICQLFGSQFHYLCLLLLRCGAIHFWLRLWSSGFCISVLPCSDETLEWNVSVQVQIKTLYLSKILGYWPSDLFFRFHRYSPSLLLRQSRSIGLKSRAGRLRWPFSSFQIGDAVENGAS